KVIESSKIVDVIQSVVCMPNNCCIKHKEYQNTTPTEAMKNTDSHTHAGIARAKPGSRRLRTSGGLQLVPDLDVALLRLVDLAVLHRGELLGREEHHVEHLEPGLLGHLLDVLGARVVPDVVDLGDRVLGVEDVVEERVRGLGVGGGCRDR